MKLVPETNYRVVNDDGSEVHSATAQKVNDIVKLMKDSKVLGDGSPVNNNVAMRIASTILTHYELRKKRSSTKQETLAESTEEEFQSDVDLESDKTYTEIGEEMRVAAALTIANE